MNRPKAAMATASFRSDSPSARIDRSPPTDAALLALSSPLSAVVVAQPLANLSDAVASPGRTPDNVKLDESRKPAEVLQFLGLRSGMNVIDIFGANKYWAEIMAPAVHASV